MHNIGSQYECAMDVIVHMLTFSPMYGRSCTCAHVAVGGAGKSICMYMSLHAQMLVRAIRTIAFVSDHRRSRADAVTCVHMLPRGACIASST